MRRRCLLDVPVLRRLLLRERLIGGRAVGDGGPTFDGEKDPSEAR